MTLPPVSITLAQRCILLVFILTLYLVAVNNIQNFVAILQFAGILFEIGFFYLFMSETNVFYYLIVDVESDEFCAFGVEVNQIGRIEIFS